ncbi:MAG: hypothetical protein ABI390_05935 [Daejeonella sp.]
MEYKFKTSIKCGGCVAAVTPFLNKEERIENWEVDTANPDKILTVNAENISADEIMATINEAGYQASEI